MHAHTHTHTHTHKHARTHARRQAYTHAHTHTHTNTHTHMYKRAQSTHKLPVHSAKGFANFSAPLAMLPPTCLFMCFILKKEKRTSVGASLATLKSWQSPLCAHRVHAFACVRVSVCGHVHVCVYCSRVCA